MFHHYLHTRILRQFTFRLLSNRSVCILLFFSLGCASCSTLRSFLPKLSFLQGILHTSPLRKGTQQRHAHSRRRKHAPAATAGQPESDGDGEPKEVFIAPLSPESPSGQLLIQLLQSHPHLVPAAAEQQLEQLSAMEDPSVPEGKKGNELVLYR